MENPRDYVANEIVDDADRQNPVMDGTVNPDYFEDDQVPRVKGLIELFEQYFSSKN